MQLLTSQLINKIICSLGCFFFNAIYIWEACGCMGACMCVWVYLYFSSCAAKSCQFSFSFCVMQRQQLPREWAKKKKCAWPAPTPGPDPSLSLEWESLVNPALGGGWAESTRRLLCWLADCLSDFRFYFPNGCTHKMPPQPPMPRGVAMQRLSAVR